MFIISVPCWVHFSMPCPTGGHLEPMMLVFSGPNSLLCRWKYKQFILNLCLKEVLCFGLGKEPRMHPVLVCLNSYYHEPPSLVWYDPLHYHIAHDARVSISCARHFWSSISIWSKQKRLKFQKMLRCSNRTTNKTVQKRANDKIDLWFFRDMGLTIYNSQNLIHEPVVLYNSHLHQKDSWHLWCHRRKDIVCLAAICDCWLIFLYGHFRSLSCS